MKALVFLASLLGLCIVFGIPVFLFSSFGVVERGSNCEDRRLLMLNVDSAVCDKETAGQQ
jgi:hypothetical protein